MNTCFLQIERLVEMSSSLAIREWRRLPSIVSHIHIPLLQVNIYTLQILLSALCNCDNICTEIVIILNYGLLCFLSLNCLIFEVPAYVKISARES